MKSALSWDGFRFPRDFGCALLLVLTLSILLLQLQIPAASATTCTNSQYIASVTFNDPSVYQEAEQAYIIIPPTPSLCGSGWSNGGLIDSHGVQYFAACTPDAFLEAGLYYGTVASGTTSGTSNPHYYYTYDNSNTCPTLTFGDASSGGTYPSFGDNVTVDIQLQSSGNPDYWMAIYHDLSNGVSLYVYNIPEYSASGPAQSAQMESANQYNSFTTTWGSLKYEATSGTWYYWPSSSSSYFSYTDDNPYYVAQYPTAFYDDWCGYYSSGC
jgi:hypothetical protein